AMLDRIDKDRRNGALAIGDQADALDSDLRAVFEEIVDHLPIDDLAIVFLEHCVAIMTAVVAGTCERHVDRDRGNPLAPLPRADAVLVPRNIGAVEDKLGMVSHAGHDTFSSRASRLYRRRSLLRSFSGSR